MANINDRINGQEFESASPLAHAVRYDRAQVKTEEQKKQARENIGCYCEAGGGSGSGSSSGGSSGGGAFVTHVTVEESNNALSYTMDKTAAEVFEAVKAGPVYAVLVVGNEDEADVMVRAVKNASYESGDDGTFYSFVMEEFSGVGTGTISFVTDSGSDYPVYTKSSGGGGSAI